MHYVVPSMLALASLAVAAPALEQRDDPWAGVLDPWGQFGKKPGNGKRSNNIELVHDDTTNSTNFLMDGEEVDSSVLLDLAKRATVKEFVGHIPGCNSADDPSNKDTPKPPYKVNQGVRIPRNGKDDECNSGSGNKKCWTVYYLVESAVEYYDWRQTGSAINCPAGAKDSCSSAVQETKQDCTTTGTSTTNGMDWKILDVGVKLAEEVVTLGGSMSWNYAKTTTDLTQACRADTSTVTCTWNNDGSGRKGNDLCHQVWYADRVLHVWGQAQRECNKCTNGNVQQNTGDGKICVRGQKQFDFRMPINKLVHCNGKCDHKDAGVPQPTNGQKQPYQAPANWKDVVIGPFTS
ncbi:hypothetical protein PGQ11_015620 [Apiospora arundinis]|uniref:Secreted protein n=1 Tax=Apiospora arundinis TaxID=335852 RepID=A0ABR2HM19_9PEZI